MGSGRNRLLECISLNEALKYIVTDSNHVNACLALFLECGLPFQWISVVEGGFDACYDVVHTFNCLDELVDYDADRCRPARYYRYKKLQESKPKAALVLKTHALNTIKERNRRNSGSGVNGSGGSGDGSNRDNQKPVLSSSSSDSTSNGNRKSGSSRTWGSMFNAAIKGTKNRTSFTKTNSGKQQRRRSWSSNSGDSEDGQSTRNHVNDGDDDDEVGSAIIAAMEAVEITKQESTSWSKSFKNMGSRLNRAVTSFTTTTAPTKVRRKSSPAASGRKWSETEFGLDSLGSTTNGRNQDDEEDDYSVDTPSWDQFTLTPKAPPVTTHDNSNKKDQHYQQQQSNKNDDDDDDDKFPVMITQHCPTSSLNEMRTGDVFVETDFTTSLASDSGSGVQWFQCEYVPNVLGEAPPKIPEDWNCDEYLLICSQHLLVVRVWRHNPNSSMNDRKKMVEKAKKVKIQAKAAAKRFGRWMSSLKTPSTEGKLDSNDPSALADGNPGIPNFVNDKDALVSLPSVISIEVMYPISDITKMTRKKKNPNVLTLYFQKTITLLCSFDDPTECTKALKKKCYDLKLTNSNDQKLEMQKRPNKIPILNNLATTISPPNSPQADATAFSFGGDTDSDEEEEKDENMENSFDDI
jgi:hypothetical protein